MKKMIASLMMVLGVSAAVCAAEVSEIAEKALEKVQSGTITMKGENGWLYSRNELSHLAAGLLAGGKVVEHSKATKKDNADPIPGIADFNDQLKEIGVKLIVVPVPPKADAAPFGELKKGDAMVYLKPFYEELRAKGVEVLDLSGVFEKSEKPVYCKQDAHWNPEGIRLAVDELIKLMKLDKGDAKFETEDQKISIVGDLMLSLDKEAKPSEEITLHTVKGDVFADASPVLLLGDSHTLIFSSGGDMLAEKSGLGENLAAALAMPVERIAVKGSAAAAVRTNLYRKAAKDADWIKGKKFVIWCFSAREFTESTSGWPKVPVLKK